MIITELSNTEMDYHEKVKIEGGGHSLKLLKRSFVTHEEAIEQLVKAMAGFAVNL